MCDDMVSFYYPVLDFVFGPVFGLPPAIGEAIVAAVVTIVITLFYKYMVDQNKMRELKTKVKELQKKQKEVPKGNTEELNKLLSEMLSLQNQQMKLNLKPMIPTLLIAVAVFPWMGSVFTGPMVILPFALPFFGNDFGWLMWYIILSIPMSIVFRKILGVEM